MKIIDENKKREIISWATNMEDLLRSQAPEVAAEIHREILNFDEHKLTIAVVGMLKRGKSTFCNAFLGRRDDMLAPIGRFPTTGIISEFINAPGKESARVIFGDQSAQNIGYSEINSYVTEDGNPENKKNVYKVEVFGNFDLDNEITLIDLPGDESIYAYHSEIVYNYLPNADIIIFLSSANDPISFSELALLRKIKSSDMKKIFFVINKADKCDDEELNDAKQHDRQTLANAGIAIENNIYTISAKNAMNGNLDCFDFKKLLNDMSAFLNQDRNELVIQSFCGRIMAIAKPIIQDLYLTNKLANISAVELEEKISNLEQQKIQMTCELREGLEEFSDNWDEMLKEFENALPQIKNNVEETIIGEIQASSILSLNKKQIEKLPEKIAVTIEKEFSTACGVLEKRAEQNLKELEKNCPSVSCFFSEYNYTLTSRKTDISANGWIANLFYGSVAYITGNAISGAFSIGSGLMGGSGILGTIGNFVGSSINAVAGTAVSTLLGPLFILSTIVTTIGVGSQVASFIRKKQVQKEKLIQELRREIDGAFNSIKFEKIPYLRKQKEVLIAEIQKEFSKSVKSQEEKLQEALKDKKSNSNNLVNAEKRKLLLEEYSALEQQATQGNF